MRLRSKGNQGSLYAKMPAVLGDTRVHLGPETSDDKPLLGAGQADVEQPPMFLEVADLLAGDDLRERRDALRLARPNDGNLAHIRHRKIERPRDPSNLGRIGRRVGEDDDRRFQALSAVDGHEAAPR